MNLFAGAAYNQETHLKKELISCQKIKKKASCGSWEAQAFPPPASRAGGSPEVVPAAEDEVGPGVEGGAQPAQPAVAAGTLEAVLVPEAVQRLQHEAVPDPPVAAGAAPRLLPGLEGHQGHACWGRETQRERESWKLRRGSGSLRSHRKQASKNFRVGFFFHIQVSESREMLDG